MEELFNKLEDATTITIVCNMIGFDTKINFEIARTEKYVDGMQIYGFGGEEIFISSILWNGACFKSGDLFVLNKDSFVVTIGIEN